MYNKNLTFLESRLVTLDDETTQAPEMPTTGPPRIIPIEELQNSKKEFMKNRKTFIMSILDKNKNKQAKKPKKLVEEEEPEEVLDEEIEEKHQIEEEQHPVQVISFRLLSFSPYNSFKH